MSAKPSGRSTATPTSAAGSSRTTQRTGRTTTDYTDQEEEYKYASFLDLSSDFSPFRRLNAQLEAKTQALVQEAEQVLVRDEFVLLDDSISSFFQIEKSKSSIDGQSKRSENVLTARPSGDR